MHFRVGLRFRLGDGVGEYGVDECSVVTVQPSLDADFKRSWMRTF